MTDEDWFIDNEDKGFFAFKEFRNDFFLVNVGISLFHTPDRRKNLDGLWLVVLIHS